MSCFLYCHLLFLGFILLVNVLPITSLQSDQSQCSSYNECGSLVIPFPFYINALNGSNCGEQLLSQAFKLHCLNSTALFLDIGSRSYQVLQFFSDGILVDIPSTNDHCRRYNDFNSFGFVERNEYFGISTENVLGLYDCEDSSICKAICEKVNLVVPNRSDCEGSSINMNGGYPGCCYPLSDNSIWQVGDGLDEFSELGCRGFSSWIVVPGSNVGMLGVKLEWAVPKNSTKAACAANAYIVNATSVSSGMRCQCQDGYTGNGFLQGGGCLKSCLKDGKEAYGKDCYTKSLHKRKVQILAGILTSALTIALLTTLFCLLKRPKFKLSLDPDRSSISFRKACTTRFFTYDELRDATKGFDACHKLADGTGSSIYSGVLGDGSSIAVQKLQCDNNGDLVQVLSQVDILSSVKHRNIALLLGCSMDSGFTTLVVYEFPPHGCTLEEHLCRSKEQNVGLEWHKRLNIAAEISSLLAFLQLEIFPPIFHHDLQSGCIFLDQDYSARVSGFQLLRPAVAHDQSHSCNKKLMCSTCSRNDVYSMGLLLLEIIAGVKLLDHPTIALQNVKNGKLEEIVDPLLYFHEQLSHNREQMQIVADLATRCLLFGGDGKLEMVDVARELLHIRKESGVDHNGGSTRVPALEETFSNSSLLQMISMSPDSIYVP